MAKGCNRCTVWTDDRGGQHHDRSCPELRWPDGHPRGTIHPEEAARGSGLTLQDELASIFKSKSEEAPIVEG